MSLLPANTENDHQSSQMSAEYGIPSLEESPREDIRERSLQSEDFCAYNLECGPWSDIPEWLTYNKNTDLSLYVNYKERDESTCSKNTTCGCNKQNVTYQETNDILLPYYYNKIGMDEPQTYNYTEYDLYSLKTRILPELLKIDSTYSVRFNVKEYEGKMHNCVEIYSGATFIPLYGDLYNRVRSIVADAMNEDLLDYCLLIHGEFPIEYLGVCMPSAWLSSILRILFMPESRCKRVVSLPIMKESCKTVTMGPYYLEDSKVYVDLSEAANIYSIYGFEDGELVGDLTYKSYGNLYQMLYKRLLNYLVDLYKLGSIVLNTTSNLIRDFELQPVVTNEEMQLGIYVADYRTHHLRDATRFLYRMLVGDKYVTVDPLVLEKLREVGFETTDQVVYIENYRDLEIIWYWSDKVY